MFYWGESWVAICVQILFIVLFNSQLMGIAVLNNISMAGNYWIITLDNMRTGSKRLYDTLRVSKCFITALTD